MDPFSLILYAVLMAVVYILTPKPKTENAAVQEGSVPAATANMPIPVVFGEVEISESNCVWWGDPSTEAIKTKSGK